MLTRNIEVGSRAETQIVVGTRDTAFHVGSGKIKVLATPVLIMLLEEAALNAVEGYLSSGFQTVGTHLDVSHIAATPVGMKVSAYAEVIAVEGRKISFRLWAEDESEKISEGTHQRIIVDVERFDSRVSAKSSVDAATT